jgi:hypothetical protein
MERIHWCLMAMRLSASEPQFEQALRGEEGQPELTKVGRERRPSHLKLEGTVLRALGYLAVRLILVGMPTSERGVISVALPAN